MSHLRHVSSLMFEWECWFTNCASVLQNQSWLLKLTKRKIIPLTASCQSFPFMQSKTFNRVKFLSRVSKYKLFRIKWKTFKHKYIIKGNYFCVKKSLFNITYKRDLLCSYVWTKTVLFGIKLSIDGILRHTLWKVTVCLVLLLYSRVSVGIHRRVCATRNIFKVSVARPNYLSFSQRKKREKMYRKTELTPSNCTTNECAFV
jgi:hypothetical protein